jgi:small-conductance mechanosensitive channel
MSDQATYNRQKFRNQIVIFGLKLFLYVSLISFAMSKPRLFSEYEWLERTASSLSLFLGANLMISIGWIAMIFWYLQKHRLQKLTRDNFVLGMNRISSVLNTVFFLIALLKFAGQDVKQLFFSISIAAAAIALISKDYISNMINGLLIMFSDQLSLGDQIRINENRGKILDITLMNVVLQNEDDDIVLIPNNLIYNTMVINQSKQNIKKMTLDFELDIKFSKNPDLLEAALKETLMHYSGNITENSFSLKIIEIKKDAVHYKIQFLIPLPNKEVEKRIKRALNAKILEQSGTLVSEQMS